MESFGNTNNINRDNVIVRGDLNLIAKEGEACRETSRQDSLENFLVHPFEDLKSIDVELVQLVPIWRNSRSCN